MSSRWKHRPQGSNWGEFGPDDQLGSMNLVGREQVLKGLAEVSSGQTFSLSLPLDHPGGNVLHPSRHPPRRFATLRAGKSAGEQCFCFALARETLRDADLGFCQLEVNLTTRGVRMPQARHTGSEERGQNAKDERSKPSCVEVSVA